MQTKLKFLRALIENNGQLEFPDEKLAGSYEKINKIIIDDLNNLYIYVISYEDIIMDRLRAYLYWGEHESKEWGMRLLFRYIDKIDQCYLKTVCKGAENKQESNEISKWITELAKII